MEGGKWVGNEVELVSQTLQVEHKLFYFDLKENPRGRYLYLYTLSVPFRSVPYYTPSNRNRQMMLLVTSL